MSLALSSVASRVPSEEVPTMIYVLAIEIMSEGLVTATEHESEGH